MVNTPFLTARIKLSNVMKCDDNYSMEIGYQGDLKISKADVKLQRPNRDQIKLKKINMAQ